MRDESTAQALIERAIIAQAHDIDDGKLDGWPDYYTVGGVYHITNRESHEAGLPMGVFHCEGRGMMADRIKAMYTANVFEDHTYCHLLGRSQIDGATDGVYPVRTNFSVIRTMQDGGSEIFAVGKYLDHMTIEDGRALLQERRVVLESRRIDILLVCPL